MSSKEELYNNLLQSCINSKLPLLELIGVLESLKLDVFSSLLRDNLQQFINGDKMPMPPNSPPGQTQA